MYKIGVKAYEHRNCNFNSRHQNVWLLVHKHGVLFCNSIIKDGNQLHSRQRVACSVLRGVSLKFDTISSKSFL